ncbi:MAG: alpha/beta fold hydrolase [Acidobacteria bacterium]|nr:alpha/beta fold hydrolase [Acidobacteriota bacterium]
MTEVAPGGAFAPPKLRPPWWARGAHAQTILAHLKPSRCTTPPWQSLALRLPDQDVLKLRVARGWSGTAVYLFHGLGGSADADYMRRAAALAWAKGHSVIAVNHRGAGEGKGAAAKPYHSGITHDLSTVILMGNGLFPDHRHIAIGFSISANMLLLLLGRDQHMTLPDAAIAVNPPVDLDACSRRIVRGLNRIYDLRFVHMLKRQVRERVDFGLIPAFPAFPRFCDLRDFDAVYTAPQGGFESREDYYAQCSAGPYLGAIETPTILLTSRDDPFAPATDVEAWTMGPGVTLHVEDRGGHMGYLDRAAPGLRWLDQALDQALEDLRAQT